MKTYATQIEIAATPERVWQVLTQDMPRDPSIYGIIRLEGELRPNGKIKLWSEVAPNRAFGLTVQHMAAPSKMIWVGGMPLSLFTGTRTFEIEARSGVCIFSMREAFTGPLSGMITKSMPDLTPSFEKFAHTLKTKAETHE